MSDVIEIALPGFEILEIVGEDARGVKYRARQTALNRDVILRLLPVALAEGAGLTERFVESGRAAAHLRHRRIAQVYDAGESNGYLYIATECVEGPTLAERIAAGDVLDDAQALPILRQLVEGLDAAWRLSGIAHMGLQPDVIAFDAAENVRITEFGLLKHLESDATDAAGHSGMLLDLHYCAPEAVAHPDREDVRVDMYALGATLYHAMTGTKPFSEAHGPAVLLSHASQQLLPPPASMGLGIHLLLSHLMARPAANRPDCWAVVLDELGRIESGEAPAWAHAGFDSVLPLPAPDVPAAVPAIAAGPVVVAATAPCPQAGPQTRTRTIVKTRTAAERADGSHGTPRIKVKRHSLDASHATPRQPAKRRNSMVPLIVFLVIAACVLGGGFVAYRADKTARAEARLRAQVYAVAQAYKAARDMDAISPRDFDGQIKRYRAVLDMPNAGEYVSRAQREISILTQTRAEDVRSRLKTLERRARALMRANDYEGAVAVYRDYNGPYARETREHRFREMDALDPELVGSRAPAAIPEAVSEPRVVEAVGPAEALVTENVEPSSTRSGGAAGPDTVSASPMVPDAVDILPLPEGAPDDLVGLHDKLATAWRKLHAQIALANVKLHDRFLKTLDTMGAEYRAAGDLEGVMAAQQCRASAAASPDWPPETERAWASGVARACAGYTTDFATLRGNAAARRSVLLKRYAAAIDRNKEAHTRDGHIETALLMRDVAAGARAHADALLSEGRAAVEKLKAQIPETLGEPVAARTPEPVVRAKPRGLVLEPDIDVYIPEGPRQPEAKTSMDLVCRNPHRGRKVIYMKFALSKLEKAPKRAILSLHCLESEGGSASLTATFDTRWTREEIYWHKRPQETWDSSVSWTPVSGQPSEIDVTAFVRQTLDGGGTVVSLKIDGPKGVDDEHRYASSRHPDSSLRPALQIDPPSLR